MSKEEDKRKELFDLYKLVIELDKYELELGWKLMQFFTVLNSGLSSLGFTMLASESLPNKSFIIPIFTIGIVISLIAIHSRKRYHKHSLQAAYKKTLIENELSLYNPLESYDYEKHVLALSTSLRKDPVSEILKNPEDFIKRNTLKKWTVPFNQAMIFVMFLIINGIGIIVCVPLNSIYEFLKLML